MVLRIFRTVLGRSDFGLYDSFFDIGGNSLMAARMMVQMRLESGCDLPLRVLFERPTVSSLAEAIDSLLVLRNSSSASHPSPPDEEDRHGERSRFVSSSPGLTNVPAKESTSSPSQLNHDQPERLPEFLAELHTRNIRLWAEGDELRWDAPNGALTPDLKRRLQQRKQDVLQALRSASAITACPGIVPLQPGGSRPPIFGVPGHNGDVFCFRRLARDLGADQPFFGLQPPGLDGRSEPLGNIEEIAAYFARQIRAFHPEGLFILAGFCAGGATAFELACQMMEKGAAPSLVCLFGCPFPTAYRLPARVCRSFKNNGKRVLNISRQLGSMLFQRHGAGILDFNRARISSPASKSRRALEPAERMRRKLETATLAAVARYKPKYFPGRLRIFIPSKDWLGSDREFLRWKSVAQEVQEFSGPVGCNPDNMLREPYALTFAQFLLQLSGKFKRRPGNNM
jgi:thioesterase domain-containing protein